MEIIIKRLFDIIVAIILIILLFPLIIFTAFIIKLSMGSPVLFRQQRPGKNEKIFNIYKFRTMVKEEGKNEDRLTKVGKILRLLSIDELPQLYNIIIGDMSFIGPRPLLKDYLDIYTQRERKRHEMRPGITGWAQIRGRNEISFKERFDLDVWYVENYSFFLDLKILFLTIPTVLKRKGIGKDSLTTVGKFDPKIHKHPDDVLKLNGKRNNEK